MMRLVYAAFQKRINTQLSASFWILQNIMVIAILGGISNQIIGQSYYFNQHEISTDLLRFTPELLHRHENGFVFIGTDDGVLQYDGNSYEKISRTDGKNETITCFFEQKDEIWIGCEDGSICRYVGNNFVPWEIPEGWPKAKITSILRDENDYLWIATYGEGVYVYADNILYNIDKDDGLKSDDIYQMVTVNKSKIIVATDFGLQELGFINKVKTVHTPGYTSSIPQDICTVLTVNKTQNILYIGTFENGIWKVDISTQKANKIVHTTEQIVDIDIIQDDKIVYQTSTSKLLYIASANQANEEIMMSKGLTSRLDIKDVMVDDEGILWILCRNNGLVSASTAFQTFSTKTSNIQAISRVDNVTYLGTEKGLFAYQLPETHKQVIKDENILSLLYIEVKNEIWCGTFGNGIIIINLKNFTSRKIDEKNGLSNNSVFSLVQQDDHIWASTLAGLTKMSLEGQVLEKLGSANGLSADYNYTLKVDSKNNLWIGTDGKGLVKIEPSGNTKYYCHNKTIISIVEDKNKLLWFASLNEGIGYISDAKEKWLALEDGLTEIHISGLTSDNDGNIITFHHTGIDIIDADTKNIINIGNNIGVRKWEQNINAFHKSAKGEIWLSNLNKVILYHPKGNAIKQPYIAIKTNTLGHKVVSPGANNEVRYDENDFYVDFSGIWFQEPRALRYRYKLSPTDNQWRYTMDQKLIYANLDPGKYTFTLQCGTNENFNQPATYFVTFDVKKAFWMTWWFAIICISSLLGLALAIVNTRNNRRKHLEAIKTENIKSQLETLKSQINPHFLFNSFNTLISVIETKPESAVGFVEKLSDFYRSILEYRDTDFITMNEELTVLNNYIFLLKQRFGESIIVDIHIDQPETMLIIPLTLQILIENAVKHNVVSKSKPLKITVTQVDYGIQITNNILPKLSTDASTHFGLQSLSKRYMSLFKKDIIVLKNKETFTIKIPLKYKVK